MYRLISDSIFDLLTHLWPFQIWPEMKTKKCKIWLKCKFSHRTVNCKKIWNTPLDALLCPLQIINWHWASIIDPSWCKCMLYPPTIQCKKLLDQSKLVNQKKVFWRTYFYTFLQIFSSKFKISITTEIQKIISTSGKLALNGQTNSSAMRYSKIPK